MTDVHVPTIHAQSLNLAETEKLERLQERLTSAFLHAGYADVRLCQAAGVGEQRKLTFLREPGGPSIISFTAIAFLASTGAELCQMIESHLVKPGKT